MPIKYSIEKELIEVKKIEKITCDKCKKDLGNKEYEFNGGYFLPIFTWDSAFDMSQYSNYQVAMCSDCWNDFYDWIGLNLEDDV